MRPWRLSLALTLLLALAALAAGAPPGLARPPAADAMTLCDPPVAPGLVAPADGATVVAGNQTLQCAAVVGAVLYKFEVYSDAGLTSLVASTQTASTSWSPGLSGNNLLYWRAAAQNACEWSAWSVTRSFKPCQPPAPGIVSPNGGVTLPGNQSIPLQCAAASMASSYRFEVYRSGGAILVLYSDEDPYTHLTLPAGILSAGAYWWRARGKNATCGTTGDWSAWGTFSVCDAPAAPTLTAPADAATILAGDSLSCSTVAGATQYKFEFATDAGFASIVATVTSSSPSAVYPFGGSNTTYYWRARAVNTCGPSNPSAGRSVRACKPAAPGGLSPASAGLPDNAPILLQCGGVSLATSYTFEVDYGGTANKIFQSAPQASPSVTIPAGTLPAGDYDWKVMATNDGCANSAWSSLGHLTICDAPAAPALIAPSNAARTALYQVALDWADVAGATGYQVQISRLADFSTIEKETTVTLSYYSYAMGAPAGWAFYARYWRVRAQDGCGDGDWSAVRSFTACLPPAPALATPGNGEILPAGAPVSLSWQRTVPGNHFHLQVAADAEFGAPLVDVTVSATSWQPEEPLPAGTYYWRVAEVSDSYGAGPWSAVRSFTVSAKEPQGLWLPLAMR